MNDEVQAVAETTGAVAEVAAKSGLSTGAKTGIICGAVAAVVAGVAGTVVLIKRHKAKKNAAVVEEGK